MVIYLIFSFTITTSLEYNKEKSNETYYEIKTFEKDSNQDVLFEFNGEKINFIGIKNNEIKNDNTMILDNNDMNNIKLHNINNNNNTKFDEEITFGQLESLLNNNKNNSIPINKKVILNNYIEKHFI